MIHDIFIPFVASKFEEMGFTKIWNPDKAVLIYDHLVPASQVDDTRHFRIGNEFVEKYGMKNIHRADGICHQLMTEAGYVKPGNIVFGTDSHTTTYGCVGAFSSGIGYTEMASILGTGTLWIRVPETIKVNITGKLPDNVMAKDIILKLIGDLGADGATYKALEFAGDTVENMSVASRMSMSNMAIEAGAKCALFTPDEKTAEYCEIELTDEQKDLVGDSEFDYARICKAWERFSKEYYLSYELTRFNDSASLLEQFHSQFDLLFLDIEVPGKNGMETAKDIRQKDHSVVIVFLTNFSKYAVTGYEVGAADYMLKPLDYYSFALKMHKVLHLVSQNNDRTLIIQTKGGMHRFSINDLLYVEINNHDLIYHLETENIMTRGSLSDVEHVLPTRLFSRCNNCYLVNLKHVTKIKDNTVFIGTDQLAISRPKKKNFMNDLTNYIGGNLS